MACATVALVCTTARAARAQVKASKDVAGLQTFLHLVQKYEGDLSSTRERLGMLLYTGETKALNRDMDEVLDFFETVGYLTRCEMLDQRLILNEFSIPVLCYWSALEPYVRECRVSYDNDKEIYEETEWLHTLVLNQERRVRHDPNYAISRRACEKFFRGETRTSIPPSAPSGNETNEGRVDRR
ncbi:MAG: DUF4760 domain-containing protein [Acidiferrobacteraceae bacterium]